jgi:outer membrane protein TolC
MKYLMRLVWSVIAGVIIVPGARAQETVSLSLDQAVALFHGHSHERRLLLYEGERLKGRAEAFRAFPNPSLNLYREGLGHGGPSYSETVVSFRQALDIYGQPSLRSRVASVETDAVDRQFAHRELTLLNEMKSRYIALLFLQRKRTIARETFQAFQRAYITARDRQAEGEISGYDLQRFALELIMYKQAVVRTDIEFESGMNSLITLLGGPEAMGKTGTSTMMSGVSLTDTLVFQPLTLSQREAEDIALTRRMDLSAEDRLLEATGRRLTIARRDRLPQPFLEIGYKRQRDGAQGYVAGASVSLPLFNQNGGAIREARALHFQQETTAARLREGIRQEVRDAYYRAEALAEQWQILNTLPVSPSMSQVAWLSYSEGQIMLLEWLDAVRSSTEAILLRMSVLTEYRQALIDLDTATGGALYGKDTGK